MKSHPNPITERFRSLAFGLLLPLAALKAIFSDGRLLLLSAMPVAISAGLYLWGFARSFQGLEAWVRTSMSAWGLATDSWLITLAGLFLGVALFFAAAFTFTLATSLLATPFSDFLAERAERHGAPALPAVSIPSMAGRLKIISLDLLKTLFTVACALGVFALSWIPGLNLLALAATFLLLAFQYVSYPQTRRGQGLRQGLGFVWRHFFASLGFGASLLGLFAIPLVSIAALPLAVVGGTLLFARAQPFGSRPELR